MYNALQAAHSGWRWIVLVLLIWAIVRAFTAGQKTYPGKDKVILFALIATHIQILAGLVLYFISPRVVAFSEAMSNASARFYTVEHLIGMLLAAGLITYGYSKAKRQAGLTKGWRTAGTWYLIGLIIIILSIPWPFREGLGGGWY